MKKIILFLTILFILPVISASCSEDQIDINSATKEKLTEIIQIGNSRAEQMITLRPFSSVDDMIRIVGIGESHLEAIKSQELACVNENEEENEEDIEEVADKNSGITSQTVSETKTENIKLSTINLTTKDIKSDDNLKLNKNDYAIYGFIVFCILLAFLFVIRKKRYNKNEFD